MKLIEGYEAYFGRYWVKRTADGIHIGRSGKAGMKVLSGADAEGFLGQMETASEWGTSSCIGVIEDYL